MAKYLQTELCVSVLLVLLFSPSILNCMTGAGHRGWYTRRIADTGELCVRAIEMPCLAAFSTVETPYQRTTRK
jgi:hypothetical protein